MFMHDKPQCLKFHSLAIDYSQKLQVRKEVTFIFQIQHNANLTREYLINGGMFHERSTLLKLSDI